MVLSAMKYTRHSLLSVLISIAYCVAGCVIMSGCTNTGTQKEILFATPLHNTYSTALQPQIASEDLSIESSSWHLSKSILDSSQELRVAIPYVSGDTNGELTNRIIYAIQALPNVHVDDSSSLILRISILDEKEQKIGYRYNPLDDEKKIIPSENRLKMLVSASLQESSTHTVVYGPAYILATAEYDHQNSSIDNNILAYSMGQLSDIDTAQDVTYIPLYRDVSDKIAMWLQHVRDIQGCINV